MIRRERYSSLGLVLRRHKWVSTEALTLTEFGETQVSKTKVKVAIGTENDSERSATLNHSCNADTCKLALVKTDKRVKKHVSCTVEHTSLKVTDLLHFVLTTFHKLENAIRPEDCYACNCLQFPL